MYDNIDKTTLNAAAWAIGQQFDKPRERVVEGNRGEGSGKSATATDSQAEKGAGEIAVALMVVTRICQAMNFPDGLGSGGGFWHN
jgi:hypothetical protein